MAYEGFQLLTYDYEDIRDAERILPRATVSAVIVVILVYVVVTLGSASLVGAAKLVERSEVALAAAGQAALGTTGLILVSVAAAFSTASAVNATLFATARLARRVAEDGELPGFFSRTNSRNLPDRAILLLAAAAIVLAMVGDLGHLVEAASLAFLVTFATVNALSARHAGSLGVATVGWAGAAGSALAAIALVVRLATTSPWVLAVLATVVLVAIFGRPLLLGRRS
jgi:amino acid transporter